MAFVDRLSCVWAVAIKGLIDLVVEGLATST